MNVCLLGASFQTPNRGVSALSSSIVDGIKKLDPSAKIFLLDYGDRSQQTSINVRIGSRTVEVERILLRFSKEVNLENNVLRLCAAVWFRQWFSRFVMRREPKGYGDLCRKLSNMDLALSIAGGDSFSDIYGYRQMLYVTLPLFLMLALGRPAYLLPQTYGPYKYRLSRWFARYLLLRSSGIIARDRQSQRVAQELVDNQKTVLFSPDVAFSLKAIRPEHLELNPPLVGPVPLDLIGLNVNGLMYNGGYTRNNMFGLKLDYPTFLTSLVTALLYENDRELWLVPHTFAPVGDVESDPEACWKLRDALPSQLRARVSIVTAEYDQHEIKGIIGMCDFFIGSRMHSCIAALSQGVPCVGVAYSMKFEGVFESVGMKSWVVDGRMVTTDEAVAAVLELYRRRDEVRDELTRQAEQARQRLNEIFGWLLGKSGHFSPEVVPQASL